ncbi:MAG: mannitol/fructose-specific phosphotransferase system IIA component (Ntr-type) [Planctomycetota bacterium]|jgi:mannitol/fructose-specific phosphotransferase system IIA component (Ntr-type)
MARATTVDWNKRFRAGVCSVGLKALDKTAALEEIAGNMVKGKALDASLLEDAVKVLHAREARATTGVGMNVSISHVSLAGLDMPLCSLSVHKDGLDWSAVDGAPVHLVFVILRPELSAPGYDPDDHISMMRWIAGLGRDGDFRAFARRAAKRSDLIELIKEKLPQKGN